MTLLEKMGRVRPLDESDFPMSVTDTARSTTSNGSTAAGEHKETFDVVVVQALNRLRTALERCIQPISRGLQNSRDLQNLLAVDRNLSWQIFKMLGPIDTLSTVIYIPAATSMKKLLTALKKRGVPLELLRETGGAFEAFESLVETTAGDRERFETMALSVSDTAEAHQIDLQHRKLAFKAHSHFFGIEVDTVINTILYRPSAIGSTYELTTLMYLVGLRRFRLDTDVMIHGTKYRNVAGESVRPYRTFNDKVADIYNAPLIPEFCTQPIPPLSTVSLPSGMVKTLLQSQEIGVGKEIDLAMGRIYKDVTLSKNGDEDYFGVLNQMTRPTKLQIVDVLVPKARFPKLSRYAATYAHATAEQTMPEVENEGVRLPMREQCLNIGSGIDVCRVGEVPRYLDLLRYSGEQLGWSVEDFDVYRIRREYPLMDTTSVLRLGIPPAE